MKQKSFEKTKTIKNRLPLISKLIFNHETKVWQVIRTYSLIFMITTIMSMPIQLLNTFRVATANVCHCKSIVVRISVWYQNLQNLCRNFLLEPKCFRLTKTWYWYLLIRGEISMFSSFHKTIISKHNRLYTGSNIQ